MPKRRDNEFRDLVNRFTSELTHAITTEVEQRVAEALAKMAPKAGKVMRAVASKIDGRRGGRLCPVPGCGQAGAGPRNRWFCKNHANKLSVTEQKSILERNKRLASEGKLPASVPADKIKRLPPKQKRARRALDMSCRVEGCPNRSRGPRAGFICDTHRQQLSNEEQKAARTRWNERLKGGDKPAETPAEPKAVAPVAPIVRKADTPIAQA
jgi:hypothetical protein